MTGQTRRTFTDEFKAGTVALLASSGQPLSQIAQELGIEPSVLRAWRRKLRPTAAALAAAPAGNTAVPSAPTADQIEICRLRRELERVQMERDILALQLHIS